MPPQPVALGRYLIYFALAYIVALAAGTGLATAMQPKRISGLSLVLIIAAAYYAGHRFVQAEKRGFNSGERLRMTLWSLLIATTLSMLMMGALAIIDNGLGNIGAILKQVATALAEMPPLIAAIIIVISPILNGAALYFAYSYLTNRMAEAARRQDAVKTEPKF